MAALLGQPSYAHLKAADATLAGTPEAATAFLRQLAEVCGGGPSGCCKCLCVWSGGRWRLLQMLVCLRVCVCGGARCQRFLQVLRRNNQFVGNNTPLNACNTNTRVCALWLMWRLRCCGGSRQRTLGTRVGGAAAGITAVLRALRQTCSADEAWQPC